MSRNLPVLVFITSSTCPACDSYKKTILPGLKEIVLKNSHKVLFTHIERRESTEMKNFHPDLERFIGWYPTFILVEPSSWNSKKKLKGVVKNGELLDPAKNNGQTIKMTGKVDMSLETMLKWIDYTVNNHKFFEKYRYNGNLYNKSIKANVNKNVQQVNRGTLIKDFLP